MEIFWAGKCSYGSSNEMVPLMKFGSINGTRYKLPFFREPSLSARNCKTFLMSINEIIPMCSTQVGSGFMHFFSLWERVLTLAKFAVAGLRNWDLLRQVKCRSLLQIHTKQLGNKEVSRQEFDGWKTPGLWQLFSLQWFLDYPGTQKVPSGNANPFSQD